MLAKLVATLTKGIGWQFEKRCHNVGRNFTAASKKESG